MIENVVAKAFALPVSADCRRQRSLPEQVVRLARLQRSIQRVAEIHQTLHPLFCGIPKHRRERQSIAVHIRDHSECSCHAQSLH